MDRTNSPGGDSDGAMGWAGSMKFVAGAIVGMVALVVGSGAYLWRRLDAEWQKPPTP